MAKKKKIVKKVAVKKAASQKVAAKKAVIKTTRKKGAVKKAAPKSKSIKKRAKPVTSKALAPVKTKDLAPIRVKAEIVDTQPASHTSTELAPLGDGLSHYLASINKYPLLSRQQETIIAERYFKDKNPKDAEILVTSNLRFVVKVAAEYSKFGSRLIDLIQEGNVGLMHAVKEFNPYKGARLITYAVWWIRGYIQEYMMRQHSMVRIGTTQNQRKLFYHLRKEKEKLDEMGHTPSVKLLSARLGIPEEDIKMMDERLSGHDISLDQPVSENSEVPRIDLSPNEDIGVDEQIARQEALHILQDGLEHLRPTLSEKEIYLLENRLLADPPVTLQDIGTEWGVTREAVRQMEARLMKKIKQEMTKLEPVS